MPSERHPSPAIAKTCMIEEFGAVAGAEHRLGDRHTDRIGDTLPERPGGHLNAGGVANLGVSRRR